MFGLGRKRPQFTPPINGNAQGGAPSALAGQPKMTGLNKLDILGGMAKDLDWTSGGGHANAAQGRTQAQMQQLLHQKQQQQQLAQLQAATKGTSPQMAALAQINPQAYAQAQLKRQLGHNTVAGGASVVTYGPNGQPNLTQANQNFQHGNLVGTVSNGQGSTYDMGASQADMNATLGHRVTDRGNTLVYDADVMKDATTQRGQDVQRFGHEVSAKGHKLGYDADMAATGVEQFQADTARFEALNPNAKPKTFNGEQSKAAGYGYRAEQANKALADLEEGGFNPLGNFRGAGNLNPFGEKREKQYETIKNGFINSVLRKESGAAISKDEYNRAEQK